MGKKIEVLVRFANEGTYYNTISIDPKKIEDPMIFTDEVFVTIDGIRVAMKKEDWNTLEQWNETGKEN
jgi:hypothetical protein